MRYPRYQYPTNFADFSLFNVEAAYSGIVPLQTNKIKLLKIRGTIGLQKAQYFYK